MPQGPMPPEFPPPDLGASAPPDTLAERPISSALERTIERYRTFHNIENRDPGAREAHNLLTEALYPSPLLPCIAAIYKYGSSAGDEVAKHSAQAAAAKLDQALEIIFKYDKSLGLDLKEAFDVMQADVINGRDDNPFDKFLKAMRKARLAATETISQYLEKIPPGMEIWKGNGTGTFGETAKAALQEQQEAENGLDLGEEFERALLDPKIQALVISLDINSTFNAGESHANTFLLDGVTAYLNALASKWKKKFGKRIYFPLSTGRPAMYQWGFQEAIAPIPEMREFSLAEEGGVVTRIENRQQIREVAVEKPALWQEQLAGLKGFILSQIADPGKVIVEPKESMLSMQLTEKGGGKYLHETTGGEPVTGHWIKTQTENYLLTAEEAMLSEVDRQREEALKAAHVDEALSAAFKLAGSGNIDQETMEDLDKILSEARDKPLVEMRRAIDALNIIRVMRQKLVSRFNSAAGYVDIRHQDLNKFSTLLKILRSKGYRPDEVLIVHIGDSGTDIPPKGNTKPGEVNDGVQNVFLIAVANSTQDLVTAVEEKGGRGKTTARPSALGLADTIKGVTKTVESAKMAASANE